MIIRSTHNKNYTTLIAIQRKIEYERSRELEANRTRIE